MEVEGVWKKMKRPRLLALIGPSGAGKSSFLRAGLLPTLPAGWRVILSTPGNRPFQSLAQALLPAYAGDMEAIQSFLDFERDTAVPLLSKIDEGSYLEVSEEGEEIRLRKVVPARPLSGDDPIWGLLGAGESGRDDVAAEHDRHLAEGEIERWRESS